VILWGRVAINKDIVVGKGAVILALSALDKSIEGGKTYFGAPAEEARKKWREMVYIKRLPELFEKLKFQAPGS
jgi:UDP-3-O-[3-hydroxymyristoyl] glucosamine N-acyltransferase